MYCQIFSYENVTIIHIIVYIIIINNVDKSIITVANDDTEFIKFLYFHSSLIDIPNLKHS